MKTLEYRYIEPLDVLFLRGNKLFGDPGSYGESMMPPWPSVAAGAIRSRMLVDRQIDIDAFASGQASGDAELGTPGRPGTFTLAGFYVARKRTDGAVQIVLPLPADLVVQADDANALLVRRSQPQKVGVDTSFPLSLLPVLEQGERRDKPETGFWLDQNGWAAYLNGEVPEPTQLIHTSDLWQIDTRVGVGLDAPTRSVSKGKLFSAQAIALRKRGSVSHVDDDAPRTVAGALAGVPVQGDDFDVGFLAAVDGAKAPEDGLLRFGGDARAATITRVNVDMPQPDYGAITASGRCRIVLTSPGLFPDGWKLPGMAGGDVVTLPYGVRARVVCAAVPGFGVLSGWDLAKKRPKIQQKAAPASSVYWLEDLEASAEALAMLARNGLWAAGEEGLADSARRAEGFNRIAIAAWPRA